MCWPQAIRKRRLFFLISAIAPDRDVAGFWMDGGTKRKLPSVALTRIGRRGMVCRSLIFLTSIIRCWSGSGNRRRPGRREGLLSRTAWPWWGLIMLLALGW